MELKQFDLEDIKTLRETRMKELRVPLVVDFYEMAVKQGTYWGLSLKDETIGYWVYLEKFVAPWYENSIIELYIKEGYRALSDEIFHLVNKQFEPKGIYVRTDDTFLLSFLLEKGYKFDVLGPLLQREKKVSMEHQEELEFIPINEETFDDAFKILLSEKPEIVGVKKEDYHRIKSEIGEDTYWILIRYGMVVGVAYWMKQSYKNYVTIVPIVHRNFRKRGYGSYMISKLANYLENKNYQPITFMNQINIAARKAFGKSGFHVTALHILFRL